MVYDVVYHFLPTLDQNSIDNDANDHNGHLKDNDENVNDRKEIFANYTIRTKLCIYIYTHIGSSHES